MHVTILKVCYKVKCYKEAFKDLEMAFILSFLCKEAEELLIFKFCSNGMKSVKGQLCAETSFFSSSLGHKSEVFLLEGSPIKNFVDCCSDA